MKKIELLKEVYTDLNSQEPAEKVDNMVDKLTQFVTANKQ